MRRHRLANLKLDPPKGRIDWSQMWNPLYMLRACIGKSMLVELCVYDRYSWVVKSDVFFATRHLCGQ